MAIDPGRLDNLMNAAAAGNDDAFGRLAEETQDAVYRLALGSGLQSADAAEATQETFLRAYQRRRRWTPGRSARSWLLGIARNVVREWRRKIGRSATGWDVSPVTNDPDTPDGAEPSVALAAAMDALPDRQREAVTFRYLMQMSVRETAEAMGCAEGTVKATTAAGIRNLRDRLA